MKRSHRPIALLMAGLLLLTSLTACDGKEESTTRPTATESTPVLPDEALVTSLLQADRFTITKTKVFTSGDAQEISVHIFTKNGNNISLNTTSQPDASDESEGTEYIDLANDRLFFQREPGGDWIVQSRHYELSDLLSDPDNRMWKGALKYDATSYGQYDTENGRYPLNPDVLSSALSLDSNIAVRGYMSCKDGVDTFSIFEDHGAYTLETVINVLFRADEVKLPDVETD